MVGKKQFREIIEEDDDVIRVWISMSSSLGLGWERDRPEALQGPEEALTDQRRLGRQEGAGKASQHHIGKQSDEGPGGWV